MNTSIPWFYTPLAVINGINLTSLAYIKAIKPAVFVFSPTDLIIGDFTHRVKVRAFTHPKPVSLRGFTHQDRL